VLLRRAHFLVCGIELNQQAHRGRISAVFVVAEEVVDRIEVKLSMISHPTGNTAAAVTLRAPLTGGLPSH